MRSRKINQTKKVLKTQAEILDILEMVEGSEMEAWGTRSTPIVYADIDQGDQYNRMLSLI